MKKLLAIFFILLANTILLAHSVLPHHHHEGYPCIEFLDCENQVCNDQDNHHSDDHSHADFCEYCVLNNFTFSSYNFVTQEVKNLETVKYFPDFSDLYAVIANQVLQKINLSFLSQRHISTKQSSFYYFINSSLGLRAPPVV